MGYNLAWVYMQLLDWEETRLKQSVWIERVPLNDSPAIIQSRCSSSEQTSVGGSQLCSLQTDVSWRVPGLRSLLKWSNDGLGSCCNKPERMGPLPLSLLHSIYSHRPYVLWCLKCSQRLNARKGSRYTRRWKPHYTIWSFSNGIWKSNRSISTLNHQSLFRAILVLQCTYKRFSKVLNQEWLQRSRVHLDVKVCITTQLLTRFTWVHEN